MHGIKPIFSYKNTKILKLEKIYNNLINKNIDKTSEDVTEITTTQATFTSLEIMKFTFRLRFLIFRLFV